MVLQHLLGKPYMSQKESNFSTKSTQIQDLLKKQMELQKNKPEEVIAETVPTVEIRDKSQEVTSFVGLSGISISETGEISKTKFFDLLKPSEDQYSDLIFTEEQARRISTSMRHLTTGVNASVPMICKGTDCPFANSCVYVQENKIPLARPCHPPGTLIRTINGEKSIETLSQDTDKVINWGARNGGTRKLKLRGNTFKLGSRHYSGELIKLETPHGSHECTDNHISFVRWKKNAIGKFIVYMMQSGDKFRIGKTQLFRITGHGQVHSGLLARMRKEGADKAWILGYYDTNSECLLAEEFFSCSWSVPKACFLVTNEQETTKWNGLYKWVTQEQLDNHFSKFIKPICYYDTLLRTIGLRYEYPHVDKFQETNKSKDFSTTKAFEIYSCNIVDDLMEVPINIDYSANIIFSDFKLSRRDYCGPVYSMNVNKFPTYIANNIITHNCLIEKQLIEYWTKEYMEEFNVDINNTTEVLMVSELAEFNIYEKRITQHLSEKHQDLLQDFCMGFDANGNEIVNKDISKAWELKEKIKTKRMKVLEALMATRKERVKIKIEEKSGNSASEQIGSLRKKIDEMQRTISQIRTVDADIAGDKK